jgi:hypothetical protein
MQVSRDGGGGSRTIAQKPWLGKYERKQALSKAGQLNRGRPLAIYHLLRDPLRKDIHSRNVLRFPLIFYLPSPHGLFYPRRAGIFLAHRPDERIRSTLLSLGARRRAFQPVPSWRYRDLRASRT